jgi:glycosyltransferase involved in cell wall biosynthesis
LEVSQQNMISVVTPAHNEERFLEDCLRSVANAAENVSIPVEHIVVLNRCTDRTEQIARSYGVRVVVEDARNLARIRNAGAAIAVGEILVTIDADSRMSANMLSEVCSRLESDKYIGGGALTVPERWSLGIFCSLLLLLPYLLWNRVSAGMFWCRKRDFDAVGGFDERLTTVEDVDFCNRLRRHGKQCGKVYGMIRKARVVTSCRKFDEFGDWYFVRHPTMLFRIIRGEKKAADKFYYDVR